jgi:anthranilate synthase component 1
VAKSTFSSSHLPAWSSFKSLAQNHLLVPVYRRIASDILTPVSAFHRLDSTSTLGSCLFESVVGGEKVGRHSFLAADPYLLISARGNHVTITRDGQETHLESDDPLRVLRSHVMDHRVAHAEDLPPFIGGAVGYAGYDVVRYVEHLPNAPYDDRALPDLSFAFYDRMIVFDHVQKTVTVIVIADIERAASSRAAYEEAARRVDESVDVLNSQDRMLAPAEIGDWKQQSAKLPIMSNFSQTDFVAAVRKCIEYIYAGDIFQVVLSQRLATPITCEPFEIYRSLRSINPSPFMFFLRTPSTALVGSSPEILCRVVGKKVTVRPLAGTRPRGKTEAEDLALEQELLADPKERAEHVMLVDLGRNDVGRVARFGSVQLSDVMSVERYSHVMHITSNVSGQLREDLDAFDALRACLPAGTVSGAPKVRAMEIIDELEPHRRGPYAGAVGYFDFSGNMDTCIALRTIVVQHGTAYVQAGAGIVADSVPEQEYEETWNKARGLLKSIELTEERCGKHAPRGP